MKPASITPAQVAAVVDRLVPVVLRYREEHPLPAAFSDMGYPMFMPQTVLLGQSADPHSRYYGREDLLAEAWRDLACVLAEPQPQWPAYDTGFEIPYLFGCYRAAEGLLPEPQVAQLRELFRPLGECLLADGPWDFAADDRINPALLRAAGLGVCGWMLDDGRMRGESCAQVEAIFAHCDENDVPSELSITYCAHMLAWAAPACEVEPRPDLLRLLAAMSRMVPRLIFEPTLELTGPDCRDQWKVPCRKNVDSLVLGLRALAVLLGDGTCEWLSRALFHRWVEAAEPNRAVYSARAPRYTGVERYAMGYGAVDSPRLVGETAATTGAVLCALKRWLGPDVCARQPDATEEYRSSRLFLHRYRKGGDVMALASIVQPISYVTPGTGLQGIELWSDDHFFWFNQCGFRRAAGTEEAFVVAQAANPRALLRKTGGPAERTLHGAARYGNFLLSLTKVDCRQELVPGIVTWAGLLLMRDREGEVVFGRGGEVERGPVLGEQSGCDWILYPCDDSRRFGFGALALETSGHATRLSNFGGDWCACGLDETAEPRLGLQALLVLAIGPWAGTPEAYAAWLRAWRVEAKPEGCTLISPEGAVIALPYPARSSD